MKMMITFALIFSASAMASVADFNYQPKQGKVLLGTQLEFSKVKTTWVSSGITADIERKATISRNDLTVGLLDNLSAKLGINYSLIDTTRSSNDQLKLNGLQDPTLEFSFRALDQSPLTLDFNLGGLVSLGEKDDDAYRGGHVVKFGSDVSRKFDNAEYFASINFDYNLESKEKHASYTITQDPSLDFTLLLRTQYQVVENAFINVGVEYINTGKTETKDTDNDTTSIEGHTSLGFLLGAKYTPIKELVLGFEVGYEKAQDYTYSEVMQGNPGTTEYTDNSAYGARLNLAYQF